MLIQGLLVGAIGGIFAYTCKIVYEANKSDDEVIEIENIVKYEYLPVEEYESENIDLNKIKYTFTEGEKEGLKVYGRRRYGLRYQSWNNICFKNIRSF